MDEDDFARETRCSMKIKVFEKMDFERGGDPKKAMGIGILGMAKTWTMNQKYEYFYSKFVPKYEHLVGREMIYRPGNIIVGFPLRNMSKKELPYYIEEFEEWFENEMPIFRFEEVSKVPGDNWYYLRFGIKREYDNRYDNK